MATAAEVKLISVGAVMGAVDKIVADYGKATGNKVNYTVGPPWVVSQKLALGAMAKVRSDADQNETTTFIVAPSHEARQVTKKT